jgi:GDP-L-fucose synthase
MGFWTGKRVMVTGGAGFLDSCVVRRLRESGCLDIFVPRSRDIDLRHGEEIRRALRESVPDIVIHLAARVGGIGANRAHPAEYFYDNLMMGIQLLHESWAAGVKKFVALGTVCAYPKYTPSHSKRTPLGRVSGRNQRPLRPGKEDAAGAKPGIPPAIRL